MWVDKQVEFADSQAVTSTAISTNVYDTQVSQLVNIGGIQGAFLVVQCDTTATDSGSDATLTVTLESADDAALSTNATVMASSGAIAFASLVGGATLWVIPLPFYQSRRYIGVRWIVASGPLTAGAFSAFITVNPQFWTTLPANNPIAR